MFRQRNNVNGDGDRRCRRGNVYVEWYGSDGYRKHGDGNEYGDGRYSSDGNVELYECSGL